MMDYEFLTMVFTAVIAAMLCLVVVGLMTLVGLEMYQAKKKADQRIPMGFLTGPGGPLEGIIPVGVVPTEGEGEEGKEGEVSEDDISMGQYL